MPTPTFTLKDGSPSAYALACGHIDRTVIECESGKTAHIDLSATGGGTYDIDVYYSGECREYTDLPSGARIMSGWVQFDSLTQARAFKRRLLRAGSMGNALASVLAHHCS